MMNKQELHEAFSQIHASEELLKEVLSVEMENKKPLNGRKIAWRIAAVAAMVAMLMTWLLWPVDTGTDDKRLITAPGVLKVYACEMDGDITASDLKGYEFPENKKFLRALWSLVVSDEHFGLPLAFEIPADYFGTAEITFRISSACEGFCEETVLANGECIYLWDGIDRATKLKIWEEVGEEKNIYLDIVIYADGNVAGYGVVACCFYASNCYAYQCTTVCFPPVAGKLQEVSEEYVRQQIEDYKQAQVEGEGTEFIRQLDKSNS